MQRPDERVVRLAEITEALAILKTQLEEGDIKIGDITFCMVLQELGNQEILESLFANHQLPPHIIEHLKICPTCALIISLSKEE